MCVCACVCAELWHRLPVMPPQFLRMALLPQRLHQHKWHRQHRERERERAQRARSIKLVLLGILMLHSIRMPIYELTLYINRCLSYYMLIIAKSLATRDHLLYNTNTIRASTYTGQAWYKRSTMSRSGRWEPTAASIRIKDQRLKLWRERDEESRNI